MGVKLEFTTVVKFAVNLHDAYLSNRRGTAVNLPYHRLSDSSRAPHKHISLHNLPNRPHPRACKLRIRWFPSRNPANGYHRPAVLSDNALYQGAGLCSTAGQTTWV